MVHFTNAERANTSSQNESASTHLERSVCRVALVVLVDSQCLPVYLTLLSDRTSNLSSVTRGSRDFRCEWTRAEITLPSLVPKSALVQTSLHTMTRVGREVDNVGFMNEVITIDSKDNQPSLILHISLRNILKQLVSSCIIYDAGPCLVLAGKVLLLTSGQTALTLNTIKQVFST